MTATTRKRLELVLVAIALLQAPGCLVELAYWTGSRSNDPGPLGPRASLSDETRRVLWVAALSEEPDDDSVRYTNGWTWAAERGVGAFMEAVAPRAGRLRSAAPLWTGAHACQRLATLLVLSRAPSRPAWLYDRAVVAMWLSRHVDAAEAIDLWAVRAYFGRDIVGIEEASESDFGKAAAQLSLGEVAFLACALARRVATNPGCDPLPAIKRRDAMLAYLLERKAISEIQFAEAVSEPPTFVSRCRSVSKPP